MLAAAARSEIYKSACYCMLFYAILCYSMLFYVIVCYYMIICYYMLRDVITYYYYMLSSVCWSMLFYVIIFYYMVFYAIICYYMLSDSYFAFVIKNGSIEGPKIIILVKFSCLPPPVFAPKTDTGSSVRLMNYFLPAPSVFSPARSIKP